MQHHLIALFGAFSPDQWAMIAAFALTSPFAQYFSTEYSKYLNAPEHKQLKETLNWTLSIALPALATIVTFLVTNPQVAQAFPIFASLYALGQAVYLASVRFVRRAKQYRTLYEEATRPEQL